MITNYKGWHDVKDRKQRKYEAKCNTVRRIQLCEEQCSGSDGGRAAGVIVVVVLEAVVVIVIVMVICNLVSSREQISRGEVGCETSSPAY